MTRWARGGDANRKKPLEATDWSELKSKKTDGKKAVHDVKEKEPEGPPQSSKHKKRKHHGRSSESLQKNEERAGTSSQVEPEPSVVDELVKLGKEASLTAEPAEKIVLEEFVRKDKRREARRVKRQQTKQESRVCFNCRQKGHDLSSCPQVTGDVDHGTGICFKCGSTEHNVHQCKVKVPHGQFPFAKCFICNEVGHLSRSCPDNPRGLYPKGGGCNHCGSVEHFKRDCPELQKKKGITEMTLSTLDRETKVDEEPALKKSRLTDTSSKKHKIVKF